MGDQNQPLNASARSNPGAVLLQARTALGLSREQLAEQLAAHSDERFLSDLDIL